MFLEPYQTTPLNGYPLKKIKDQLEVAFINGELSPVEMTKHERIDQIKGDLIYEILPGQKDIDLIQAPVVINTRGGIKVVIDSRATKRQNKRTGGYKVISESDYRFAFREAVLTYQWNVPANGAKGLNRLGELPLKVYSSWITESISRRLGIDPYNQMRLQVLSAFFYNSLFSDERRSPKVILGNASIISRLLRVTIDQVMPIVNEASDIHDINSFVEVIRSGENAGARLKDLNPGLVYTLLNSSWYGANKATIIGSAVEYPPTFLTMLLSAYTERSYKSSMFTKLAMRVDKKKQAREFTIALNHATRGLTDE